MWQQYYRSIRTHEILVEFPQCCSTYSNGSLVPSGDIFATIGCVNDRSPAESNWSKRPRRVFRKQVNGQVIVSRLLHRETIATKR